MINIKKYLALFLVLMLLLSHIPVNVNAQTNYPMVTLSIMGNLNTIDSIPTIYTDNNLYASIQDLCKLVEADITETTDDYVTVIYSHGGSCHNLFYRSNSIKAFIDGTEIYSVECPQIYYDDTIYISVLHFLEYLGIDSKIEVAQNKPTLLLYRQYSMFDVFGEYISDNSYYWFDLEASGIIEDCEKAALLTLISSDPNLIKMLFDADGIYREGIEDTVIEIIRNEGVTTSRNNPYSFDSLETASDGLGLADQYIEMLGEALEKDGFPIDGVTQKYFKKIDNAAKLAPIVTGYFHTRLFDNMTVMQQSILSETIIDNRRYSKILTDDTGSLVVDAAEKVHLRINEAHMNYSAEAIDIVTDYIIETTMSANSVTLVTNTIMQGYFVITETLIPDKYEYAEAVNHAFNCYVIQVAANEIFHGLFDEFCENSFFIGNKTVQTQYLRQMKYALILQLKAAITLRDKLIEGDCLDDDGAFFAQLQNNHATQLLVNLESAEEVFPFELDLSNVETVNMSTTPESGVDACAQKQLTRVTRTTNGKLTEEYVFSYNSDGLLVNYDWTTRGFDNEPEYGVVEIAYDSFGRVIRKTHYVYRDGQRLDTQKTMERESLCEYDGKGQLTKITTNVDGEKAICVTNHNEQGQVIEAYTTYSDDGYVAVDENYYEYDEYGRLSVEVAVGSDDFCTRFILSYEYPFFTIETISGLSPTGEILFEMNVLGILAEGPTFLLWQSDVVYEIDTYNFSTDEDGYLSSMRNDATDDEFHFYYDGETVGNNETQRPTEDTSYSPSMSEDELLSIMQTASNHQIEKHVYLDMDCDGSNELLGLYTNNGICCAWYCSSDGSVCKLVHENDEGMDSCEIELLTFDNAIHVVLNAYRMMGTGKNYSILALENKDITCIVSNEYGYVCMRDTGDITLNVEAYDGMYDASLDMMMLHTWKDTYLYFDGTKYKEYGATEISDSAYFQYENARAIAQAIEAELTTSDTDRIEYSYYVRANGILHIQCDIYSSSGSIDFGYYTLRYTGNILDEELGDRNYGQMSTFFSNLDVTY